MVLPKYVETQWYGEGKSVLMFCPKDGQVDNDNDETNTAEGKITCYISSLRICEYEERTQPKSADDNSEAHEDLESEDSTAYICPPGVSSEVWQEWLVHWNTWKDIYIPLAWVQKNRKECTQAYIDWHDSFIEENPWVLPVIREGISEETSIMPLENRNNEEKSEVVREEVCVTSGKGDDLSKKQAETESKEKETTEDESKEKCEEETKENWDELYQEFSGARYWIHLRNFLQSYDTQPSESLVAFFSEHGHLNYCGESNRNSYIPEFMKNNWETTCDTGKLEEVKDSKTAVNEPSGDSKLTTDDSVANDEGDNRNSADNCGQNDSEELDKIGTKRRQDTIDEGLSEDGGFEKSCAMLTKRPRHNPLLEKNSDVRDKESDCDTSDNDGFASDPVSKDNDVDVDSDDKENSEWTLITASSKNNKKSSKQKKKKKALARPIGLAWAMKYFENDSVEKEDCDMEKQDKEKDVSPVSADTGNIFSVADNSANCISEAMTAGNVDGLGNLPSANYQFRADILNLKEDLTELSKCFNVQSESLSGTDTDANFTIGAKACTELTSSHPQVDSNDEASSETEQGKENEDYDDDENDDIFEENDDGKVTKESDAVTPERTLALRTTAEKLFWFIPDTFPAIKNFFIMCTSQLLSLMLPSVLGNSWLFSDRVLGRLPFFRKLMGSVHSKDAKIIQRKPKKECQKRIEEWLHQKSGYTVQPHGSAPFQSFYTYVEERETQTLYQSLGMSRESDGTPYVVVNTLDLQNYSDQEVPGWKVEDNWRKLHVTFDDEGNPISVDTYEDDDALEREQQAWKGIIANHKFMSYKMSDRDVPPPELPKHLHKYWAQRHRLFLRYDEGIKLDEESWYSVTPEMIAAHHAYRCKCNVVVDAFCGSGGNAIQLASTCKQVIAIDIDPAKIELARHNAEVYGVEEHIKFIVGDFFELAPQLKADVVFLSPPWGGTEYLREKIYDVKKLGGVMDCEEIMKAARLISKNIALYLPKSSNLCQVIELAELEGKVDLEYNIMGKKQKALTAYFEDLVHY